MDSLLTLNISNSGEITFINCIINGSIRVTDSNNVIFVQSTIKGSIFYNEQSNVHVDNCEIIASDKAIEKLHSGVLSITDTNIIIEDTKPISLEYNFGGGRGHDQAYAGSVGSESRNAYIKDFSHWGIEYNNTQFNYANHDTAFWEVIKQVDSDESISSICAVIEQIEHNEINPDKFIEGYVEETHSKETLQFYLSTDSISLDELFSEIKSISTYFITIDSYDLIRFNVNNEIIIEFENYDNFINWIKSENDITEEIYKYANIYINKFSGHYIGIYNEYEYAREHIDSIKNELHLYETQSGRYVVKYNGIHIISGKIYYSYSLSYWSEGNSNGISNTHVGDIYVDIIDNQSYISINNTLVKLKKVESQTINSIINQIKNTDDANIKDALIDDTVSLLISDYDNTLKSIMVAHYGSLYSKIIDVTAVYDKGDDVEYLKHEFIANNEYNRFSYIENESSSELAEEIVIRNVDDLIQNIGSNRTLLLMPGVYNLDHKQTNNINEELSNHVEIDRIGQLIIKDVQNLKIEGLGQNEVEILTNNISISVLSFIRSSNVSLENLKLGHGYDVPPDAPCKGPVVVFTDSSNISIERCTLYGCGSVGIVFSRVNDAYVFGTIIEECSFSGISLSNLSDIAFNNCVFRNNKGGLMSIMNSDNILFTGTNFLNNKSNNIVDNANNHIIHDYEEGMISINRHGVQFIECEFSKSLYTILIEFIRQETVGPISWGMPELELIAEIGEPDSKSSSILESVDNRWAQTWEYNFGVQLRMSGNGTKFSVRTYKITQPCDYKTSRNIGIGSTLEELLEVYSDVLDVPDNFTNLDSSEYVVIGSLYWGILFTIEENAVASIAFAYHPN